MSILVAIGEILILFSYVTELECLNFAIFLVYLQGNQVWQKSAIYGFAFLFMYSSVPNRPVCRIINLGVKIPPT